MLGQPQISLMLGARMPSASTLIPGASADLRRWNILLLKPAGDKLASTSLNPNLRKSVVSWKSLLLVLVLHIGLLLLVLHTWQLEQSEPKPELPMMVSLLNETQSAETPHKQEAPKIEPVKQKPIEKPVREKKQAIPVTSTPSTLNPVAEALNPIKPEMASIESKSDVESDQADSKSYEASEKNVQKEDKAVIEPPQFGVAYLNNPAPAYPSMSRRFAEQGQVVLRVLVSASGDASSVSIERSSQFQRLDQAAVEAVKKWRFVAAKKNNQPVAAEVLVPFKFSLDK